MGANKSGSSPRMLLLVLEFIYDFRRAGSWLFLRGFFFFFLCQSKRENAPNKAGGSAAASKQHQLS